MRLYTCAFMALPQTSSSMHAVLDCYCKHAGVYHKLEELNFWKLLGIRLQTYFRAEFTCCGTKNCWLADSGTPWSRQDFLPVYNVL